MPYRLYLESGPRRRKTMVHVIELLGCIANGATTEEALDATAASIDSFRNFLAANTDEVPPTEDPADWEVIEHITEGTWLGNGSPYLMFGPDFEPLGGDELELLVRRFEALRGALTGWVERQSDDALRADPGGGRAAIDIVLHVISSPGGYLSAALGGAPGFSGVTRRAERGEMSLVDALRENGRLAAVRLRATTPEEQHAVIERARDTRTLRKAVRRLLEHEWEHLAELARRPGGPSW